MCVCVFAHQLLSIANLENKLLNVVSSKSLIGNQSCKCCRKAINYLEKFILRVGDCIHKPLELDHKRFTGKKSIVSIKDTI